MSVSKSRGFTLIELMVVVLVIAVLAIIALPSYLAHVRKSRRSEAITQITAVALAEEQWRTNCPGYATAFSNGTCGANTVSPTFMAAPTLTYYTFALTAYSAAQSATRYTITATAVGTQVKDQQFGVSCGPALTYDFNAGVITKGPDAKCWGQ